MLLSKDLQSRRLQGMDCQGRCLLLLGRDRPSGIPRGRVSGLQSHHQRCDSSFWLFGIRVMRLFFSKSFYNTGHDVLTLTESGFHYFITSNQAQCVSGQKLKVLVIHDPSRPIPPPPPSKTLPVGQTYKVGDSKGWKVYDSDFYNKWSEEKQFQVGDTLLFEYATEINDVYEISGALVVRKTGHDLVRLTEPGVHYFITSHSGHCEAKLSLTLIFPRRLD
ncbi:hypothetical protein Bca52824_072777 [Brassica carinata]|uniref:Phytocyanin domain-containing protein n=1 Tax=Brassica carinata TaxID=52824 RepID=A0A8X7QCS4_BRACI|nr:hypothetical protein Bca52824_072777 [Brassica carinata]